MSKPTVSIIIPAYNTADVIHRTLAAIEQQTFRHYEVVIINDGSTDETKTVLDTYQQSHCNVIIHHQQNQGVSAARNKGIELASGEFVCFLDSDDTYEPEFLELMVAKQQTQDCDVIYCGYNRVGHNNKKSQGTTTYYQGAILEHFFQRTRHLPYLFHLSCLLIRKSILIENSLFFEVERKISEDVAFIAKLITLTDFDYVDKNLYNYFYRENSAVNVSYFANIKSDIRGWQNMTQFIQSLDPHKFNTAPVLMYIEEHTLRIILSLLKQLLKKFKYQEIREIIQYYNLKSSIKRINQQHFSSTERAIIRSIENEQLLKWMALSIYYRFFKINLKSVAKLSSKSRKNAN